MAYIGNSPDNNESVGLAQLDSSSLGNVVLTSDSEINQSGGSGTSNTAFGKNAGDSIASGGNYNVALGEDAGTALSTGDDNIAIGWKALDAATTMSDIIAIGTDAGGAINHNDADGTVVIGHNAGAAITQGQHNTTIGFNAGAAISTGDDNVALGYQALKVATTGGNNVAIGKDSLLAADGAESHNVAIGVEAMLTTNNDSSVGNVAIGTNALDAQGTNTSDYNTCVGYQAGTSITSGVNNTCIGKGAGGTMTSASSSTILGKGCDAANGTGAIVAGYNCDAHAAGTYMTIGTGNGTDRWWIHYGSDTTWARESDERLKKDIADSSLGLDFVNDLRAVKYRFKTGEEQPDEVKRYRDGELQSPVDTESFNYGMLAQDVKSALDTAEVDDWNAWSEDDNGIQSLSVASFVIPLIKAVQELSAKVEALENA